MVNKDRLERDLKRLGAIGWREEHGLARMAYSEQYIEARDYVQRLMTEAGMLTRVDPVGNLFGFVAGSCPETKTILLGSHLDAVPGGGIYDGAVGVIGALEAVRGIREQGLVTRHSLEVAAFIAEEGGDLGGTFGSRAFVGEVPTDMPDEVLGQYRLSIADVEASRGNTDSYCCYLELHIEQGPVLWEKGIPIGIPTAIVGISRYKVRIVGEANHAGTTPMINRKDALRAAVRVLDRWYDLVDHAHGFVCNIGTLKILPGSVAVVPGEVEFVLELRSTDDATTELGAREFEEMLHTTVAIPSQFELLVRKPAVRMSESLVNVIQTSCAELGIQYLLMPSGASHDASPLARHIPAGMVFVPSVKGVSHRKDEFTPIDDIATGVEVLMRALLGADGRIP